jgi:hypothetical protein
MMAGTTGGRWSAGRTILFGGLVVGILDGLDAVIFFGLRGVSATRIFQAIAAGVLGRDASVAGGVPAALLGVLLHFIIACGIVATYYLVSRRLAVLTRFPLVSGPLYGILVYWVMQLIVLPLSAVPGGNLPRGAVLVNGLVIHLLGVGLPAALFTARGVTGNWSSTRMPAPDLATHSWN